MPELSLRWWAAFVWIACFVFLSIFAVIRAPIYLLWKPAVAAIEMGLVLAVVLAVGGGLLLHKELPAFGYLCAAMALGCMCFLSPWVRALWASKRLAAQTTQAWGSKGLQTQGLSCQEQPYAFSRLFGTSSPQVHSQRFEVEVDDGARLPLDLYRGPGDGPKPLVVAIHGGAWAGGDLTQLPEINSYLAARGFQVAAITYRLSPAHRFPTHLNDVKKALLWLRENAKAHGIDPQKIVLLGRSAGGHLALLAAYRKVAPGIRGVISFYGPTDLHWSWAHPANPWVIDTPKTLRDFLGGSPQEVKARYDEASPLLHAAKGSPPTLLIHGGRDELVSLRQSQRLAEKLKGLGVDHQCLELPWASHGLEASLSGPSGQIALFAIERFLVRVVGEKASP